ncbi:MAG: hypothetical protein KDB88_04330 [Flavobacteriales bacterium]|nr:hypothetical protein [Flavobacteriales bacterium]
MALLCNGLFAQAPEAFNYQAVARDAGGDALANTTVGVQFQLHQSTAGGTVVYAETHSPTTNELGLFSVDVGNGTSTTGTFAAIDWSAGPYFLEVGLDPAGGNSYTSVGTQPLLSVPYALLAGEVTHVAPGSLFGEDVPPTYFTCMNEVGSISVNSAPNDVVVSGDHAYVLDPLSGNLQVIAISNPAAPSAVGSLTLTGFPFRMRQSGDLLYVLQASSGELSVVDISTPTTPVARGSVSLGAGPSDVAVEGTHAYVVSNTSDQLDVIDVSDPDAPFAVGGGYALGSSPVGIEVQGGLAYVIDLDADDLKVIDVSTPTSPSLLGSVGIGTYPAAIALQGDHAYVVDLVSTDLKVIDVGLPSAPAVVGSVNVGPAPLAIEVVGDFAFVVDQFHQELKVFDVSQASAPSNEEVLSVGPVPQDVAIQGNYAYVISDGDNALKVIELTCQTGVGYTPLGGFSTLQEDDPQVGQFLVNAVPRWNGESLNLGSIYDTGIGTVTVPHTSAQVGIGTSTPSAKLDVRDASASELRLSLSGSHWSKLRFSSSEGLRIEAKNEGVEFRPMLLIGSELKFYSGLGTTPERMRLTSNGLLGIGTNNPTAHLEVNGYTKLGSDAPAIKQKVVTGTYPAQNSSVLIPHGLTSSKILSVHVIVDGATAGSYTSLASVGGKYSITSTSIRIQSDGTALINPQPPLKMLITYME